jgi:hypothetical protein
MADQSHHLLLEALNRAVTEPAGLPLFSSKAVPGLFAATAAGRKIAQLCKDQGYIRPIRTEPRGKTVREICAISEQGLQFLLQELNPKKVLESLVSSLESRRAQLQELVGQVGRMQASFEALKAHAARVLEEIGKRASPAPHGANGADPWLPSALEFLRGRDESKSLEDCSLPELFAAMRAKKPGLTIGQFHDGLRRLVEQQCIFLHPWTGPLYEIPQPALALMVGHEIAYYASLRK